MLARGVTPFVTLYHWDLPQALQDAGGWLNRRTADWFADYAAVCARRLGDRARLWATINEPNVVAFCGFEGGWHAPGVRDRATALQVFHHLMLAHGRAVKSVRATRQGLQLGICPNIAMEYPERENHAADRRAAEAKRERERYYLDPFLMGRYPAVAWRKAERDGVAPLVKPGDLKEASPSLDFLGVNYYFSRFHRARPGRDPLEVRRKVERTDLGWPFCPEGLRDALGWVTKTYGRYPLYVTESGAAYFGEKPGRDGRVRDGKRVAYLALHAEAVRRAVARGADVRGYFVWSLMDNLEWSSGYKPRFGLVHVDFKTQKRVIKDSGRFIARLAASNGACLAGSSFF